MAYEVDSPERKGARGGGEFKKHVERRRRNKPRSTVATTTTVGGPGAATTEHKITRLGSAATKTLEESVQELSCYNNKSDDQARRVAMDYLEKILARWTLTLRTLDNSSNSMNQQRGGSVAATTSNNPWQRPRAALVSFGSYRLGVHRTTSDLDVLAVGPPTCTRHDFFTSLVELLRSDSSRSHGVSDVHPIPGAYTPVIKFSLQGFSVDMVFARVADATKLLEFQQKRVSPLVALESSTTALPARVEYPLDDSDLLQLDEAGVRSVNGARVSQMLLELVPDRHSFRIVLRAVKEWAVQAGIYSNVLGFLGGVNWAILVAWVCVRHKKESCETIIHAFFRTFATWEWPVPVLLGEIQDRPPRGVLPLPVWDPSRNLRDGLHIMPIITPVYPSMNSSYNVGIPQRRRICHELTQATNRLRKQKRNRVDYTRALFAPSDFFQTNEHFLQITIQAANRQDFVQWFRLVESRLRLLITNLETPEMQVWPFAKFFDCPPSYRSDTNNDTADGTQNGAASPRVHESLFFMALRFGDGVDSINIKHLTSDFLHKLNSYEQRKLGMDLRMEHVLKEDLPAFVVNNSNASAMEQPERPSSPIQSEPTKQQQEETQPMEAAAAAAPTDGTVPPVVVAQQSGAASPDLFSPHKRYRMSQDNDDGQDNNNDKVDDCTSNPAGDEP